MSTVITVFFLLLALSGVAHGDVKADEDALPQLTQDTFKTGFFHIVERYIEEVDLAFLSHVGLAKMATIDPAIVIERRDQQIRLLINGQKIYGVAIPQSNNPEKWARIITQIIALGRDHSVHLQHAALDEITSLIFNGMIDQLDPYSRYVPPTQARKQKISREGFHGVGVRIRMINGYAQVIETIADGPAEKSGIQPGDRFISVDGQQLHNKKLHEVTQSLNGKAGSWITLTIERNGTPMTMRMQRQFIIASTVFPQIRENMGYLRISSFNKNTATDLQDALHEWREDIENDRITGIILDLRSNNGGLLKQAVHVADAFLTGGVILTTRGRHPDSFQNFGADWDDLAMNIPMAVLIDDGSASAAEITAAALQDQGRSVIIGENSYGKGTVQNVIDLPNNAELMITWSRLHAPSGYSFDQRGILPMVCTSRNNVTAAKHKKIGKPTTTAINHSMVSSQLRAALHQWRSGKELTGEAIDKLRDLCRNGQKMLETTVETAIAILKNPRMYAEALAPPYPIDQTHPGSQLSVKDP